MNDERKILAEKIATHYTENMEIQELETFYYDFKLDTFIEHYTTEELQQIWSDIADE